MTIVKYLVGADRPDISVTWRDDTGAIINFSTGYSFEFKIGHGGYAAVLTKTSGITGAATSPNITVVFGADEFASVPPKLYEGQIRAREISTSKDRFMQMWFLLLPSVS